MANIRTALAVIVVFLSCSPSFAVDRNLFWKGKPPPGSIHVGNFTPGGCDQVCEDIGYCIDWRSSIKDGSCWLIINRKDPRFVEFAKSCPQQRVHAKIEESGSRLLCKGDD